MVLEIGAVADAINRAVGKALLNFSTLGSRKVYLNLVGMLSSEFNTKKAELLSKM